MSSYYPARTEEQVPELLQELHVGVAVDELDELFVGRGVGVSSLVMLVHVLSALQLGQQHLVDEVGIAEECHHGLQDCGEESTAENGSAL